MTEAFCLAREGSDGSCVCNSFSTTDSGGGCWVEPATDSSIMGLFYAEMSIAIILHSVLFVWTVVLLIKSAILSYRAYRGWKQAIDLKMVFMFLITF
jgi:hypothetical protein